MAAHGPEKIHDVHDKSGDDTDRDKITQCQPTAQERSRRHRQNHHGGEHRSQSRCDKIGADADFAISVAGVLELSDGAIFLGIGLHSADAGDVLLHNSVQYAQVLLHTAESHSRAFGDLAGDKKHDRQDDQSADSQGQVEQEHRHHDAAQGQDVGGELNQPVGQNLVDGLAVI